MKYLSVRSNVILVKDIERAFDFGPAGSRSSEWLRVANPVLIPGTKCVWPKKMVRR